VNLKEQNGFRVLQHSVMKITRDPEGAEWVEGVTTQRHEDNT
jgi:hypothetical protein